MAFWTSNQRRPASHGTRTDRSRLRRLYVDTASLGPVAIAAAVQALGADRVPLGTDAPIFPAHMPRQGIENIGLGSEALAALKSGNGLWR